MQVSDPTTIEAPEFDARLSSVPNADGVFLVWAGEQSAYLAKTSMLKRRLLRILNPHPASRRLLNLRGVATRVDYWLTGSRFESGLVHYALARRHSPDTYVRMIKLRMPAYVRLMLDNPFPRTQVTTRIGTSKSIYYGPFRTRGAAEQFEAQTLDLFQVRRCQEDLEPSPHHPGCIYGEMNMCMRPCQQVVGAEEYRSEANRLGDFLLTNGAAMLNGIATARERFSEEMQFEEAARQHKRFEQVSQILAARDELVTSIDQLYGVAVMPSLAADSVRLFFLWQGSWQRPLDFALTSHVSMDTRLREIGAALQPVPAPRAERPEHLALLARWFYSSWRDGEWLNFPTLAQAPYRKLVRAISRVHAAKNT